MRFLKANLHVLTSLCASVLITTAASAADQRQCENAVDQRHYSRLTSVCIDLPHRNRMEKMRLLMNGEYTHYLGTLESPSTASLNLRNLAENGDIQAQYVYAQLLVTVHSATPSSWDKHPANKGDVTMEQYNSKVKQEANKWTRMAAVGGHSLANLEFAESKLLTSYTDKTVDLDDALRAAGRAKSENPLLADTLIERIKNRIRELD